MSAIVAIFSNLDRLLASLIVRQMMHLLLNVLFSVLLIGVKCLPRSANLDLQGRYPVLGGFEIAIVSQ